MSIEHTVWSLDGKKPLVSSELKDEKELELLIVDNIEILNKGWLVLGNQVKTAAGKFIDILCMDYGGDLVVIELKKGMTPREVTAQVIDYAASVSMLTTEELAQMYLDYSKDDKTLNEAYKEKYGIELDEENVNQKVKMVVVASQMDNSTERIVTFLCNTYGVDINILFFNVFKCGDERIISRAWFKEDENEDSIKSNTLEKNLWNGEYYISYGTREDLRNWDDAMKYGFISAGGGDWYSHTLGMLSPGDRVWVNIPKTGYVGVGIVEEEVQQAKDVSFMIDGKNTSMKDLPLKGNYFYNENNSENAEYVVKVHWLKTVPENKAIKELGFFGNQNSVCRPTSDKWDFTIERLKKYWEIDD